mmetsp:Transcript_22579/g.27861  ORF Transcript_22579/g.27861 Transcript_22579/m.27861 type:complete len:114 (+) Transcript_22579:163-504(+)
MARSTETATTPAYVSASEPPSSSVTINYSPQHIISKYQQHRHCHISLFFTNTRLSRGSQCLIKLHKDTTTTNTRTTGSVSPNSVHDNDTGNSNHSAILVTFTKKIIGQERDSK